MTEWFKDYYAEDYAALVRPLLTPERTRREVDFLLTATGLGLGSSIADLACGMGRHALEFAHRGHLVTGVELNAAFLAQARRESMGLPVPVRWVQGDMRRVTPGLYDLVSILFHSFGFFSDEDNAALLRNWTRERRPEGWLALDVWNRARILEGFEARRYRTASDDLSVIEDRTWDAASSRLQMRQTLPYRDGTTRVLDASFRLYTLAELRSLLADLGLEVRLVYGSLYGDPWSGEAPRLVVLASRPQAD